MNREITAAQAKLPRTVLWEAGRYGDDDGIRTVILLQDGARLLRLSQDGRVSATWATTVDEFIAYRDGGRYFRSRADALAVLLGRNKKAAAKAAALVRKTERQLAAARKAGK